METNISNNPPPTAPELNRNQNANPPATGNETARKAEIIALAAISVIALSALVCSLSAVVFFEGLGLTILAGSIAAAVLCAAFFLDGTATVHSYYTPRSHFYQAWRPIYTPPVVVNSYFPRLNPIISYQPPLVLPRTVPPVRMAPSTEARVPVGRGHAHAPIRPAPFGGRVPVGGRRF